MTSHPIATSKPKAALLVLNYNSYRFLPDLIDSVNKQTYSNCDLFIIDNNSSDNSIDSLNKHYPSIKLIQNKKNLGVGGGFNQAITQIDDSYKYIAFFNPDIILDKQWVKKLVETLESTPDVQMCCGLILDWKGRYIQNAGGIIVNIFVGIFGGFLDSINVKDIPKKYKNSPFPIFYAPLTAMIARSEAFKTYGLFDPDYFMSSEEADFCWRVWLSGKKVLCNPQTYIRHFIHGSKFSKRTSLFVYGKTETNMLLTYYKNLKLVTFIILILPLTICRSLIALSYLYISPKITFVKLSGIFSFFPKMFSSKYINHRSYIEKMRKKSDLEVFSNNPISVFSFHTLYSSIFSWFKTIKVTFQQSNN